MRQPLSVQHVARGALSGAQDAECCKDDIEQAGARARDSTVRGRKETQITAECTRADRCQIPNRQPRITPQAPARGNVQAGDNLAGCEVTGTVQNRWMGEVEAWRLERRVDDPGSCKGHKGRAESGCAPMMVETKMARTLHAWRVSSAGQGMTKRMMRPTAIAAAAVLKFAGCNAKELLGGARLNRESREMHGECRRVAVRCMHGIGRRVGTCACRCDLLAAESCSVWHNTAQSSLF